MVEMILTSCIKKCDIRMDSKHLFPQLFAIFFLIQFSDLIVNVSGIDRVPPDDLEYCDYDEMDNAQSEDSRTEPSFCQEVILNDNPNLYTQDDFNILAALSTSLLTNQTYPYRLKGLEYFVVYDELPYPIPTGASTFFMVLFTMIFTWYFSKLLHHIFRDAVKELNLVPATDRFPSMNLYMLQQSRREGNLNRDVRNTWAWLANFYLLKITDDAVNAEEIENPGEWTDFQIPKDVWAIVREVLKANAMDAAAAAAAAAKKKLKKSSSDTGVHNDIKMAANDPTASDPGEGEEANILKRLRKLVGAGEDDDTK